MSLQCVVIYIVLVVYFYLVNMYTSMRSFYSSVVLAVFTAYVALFSFSLVVEAQNDDELEQLLQEINNELEA